MRDYPNMSYCMYQNTLLAVKQLLDALADGDFPEDAIEQRAAQELMMHAETLAEAIEEGFQKLEEENDYDDSMDGDHASALASAGFGTDEDYGYTGEEY